MNQTYPSASAARGFWGLQPGCRSLHVTNGVLEGMSLWHDKKAPIPSLVFTHLLTMHALKSLVLSAVLYTSCLASSITSPNNPSLVDRQASLNCAWSRQECNDFPCCAPGVCTYSPPDATNVCGTDCIQRHNTKLIKISRFV
jgi:hypothetical protein